MFKVLLLIWLLYLPPLISQEIPLKWIAYYADSEEPENFNSYSVVVFDSDDHPPIEGLLESGKTVLGYLSLGEVSDDRFYFPEVKKEGILLNENKSWKGAYFVDLRDKRWTKRVIEELIPSILYQRFNGIFIDTIDNAEHLEESDPKKYQGMKQAAVNLIKTIRLNYPNMKIMLNRGFDILPQVASQIDMELGESIYTDYNPKKHAFELVAQPIYDQYVRILKDAKKQNPHLEIFTLDYWDIGDKEGMKKIYRAERANGFSPYVSTMDLTKIVPEPS